LRRFAAIIVILSFHVGTALAFQPVKADTSSVDDIVNSIANRRPAPAPEVQVVSPRSRKLQPARVTAIAPGAQYQTLPRQSAALQKKQSGPVALPRQAVSHVASRLVVEPRDIQPPAVKIHEQPKVSVASLTSVNPLAGSSKPPVKAKAMFCIDCSANKVVLAQNISEPLPIASITKLLTALVVIEEMDLDKVLEVPADIAEVERVRVGIHPGDLLTVRDLLHGMLIESGNDCAETLARAYPKGGREGFLAAMNRRAKELGASRTTLFTPSGLDMKLTLGRKEGRNLDTRWPNTATAEDVAIIARQAFKNPLIARIASMKTYTMHTRNGVPRDYHVVSNDRLLTKNLPIAGAKTGFTNKAGKCIVAWFKDQKAEHMVVVLNTAQHFKAAEKIYRWASRMF
jgi:D-alanyl-D-alanine carboxypeptidase